MTNNLSSWPEDALETATEALRELPVPDGPSAAVLQRTLETLQQTPTSLHPHREQSWWSIRSLNRLAVAAGLILVVLVGAWWGLGDGGRKVMADGIMERLRQAQAVQLRAAMEINTPDKGLQASEALMTIVEPSWMLFKVRGMNAIVDLDKQKMMLLDSSHKLAMIWQQKELPAETGSVNILAELKRMDLQNASDLGSRDIDGHPTNGYAIEQGDIHMSVWFSAATQLPVYVELEIHSAMLPSAKMTYRDFNWNPVIDPNPPTFNVPAGYSVQNFELDLSDITEHDVVMLLRNAARLNRDEFPENLGMYSIMSGLKKSSQVSGMSVLTPPVQLPQEFMGKVMAISRGWIFIGNPQNGSDWHYAGKGVKLNAKDQPVLWYKPTGSEAYRVINADLTIHEAPLSDLPAGEPVKPDWPTTGVNN